MQVAENEKRCKGLQKDEQTSIKTAQQVCEQDEEIEPSLTTAALNKRRQQIQIRLEKEAEKAGGRTLDAITDDLARAKRARDNATRSMVHVMKTQEFVDRGFKARKKKYMQFRRATAASARKSFNRVLGKKGELRISCSCVDTLPCNVCFYRSCLGLSRSPRHNRCPSVHL